MSVRDRWPFSRYEGWVRIETRPHTPEERRQLRQGSVVIVVGFTVLAMSQDWVLTTFAMALAGVFVRILFG